MTGAPVQLDVFAPRQRAAAREEATKEAVMDRHEMGHRIQLAEIRQGMAAIYRSRLIRMGFEAAYVSPNDVRRWLELHPEHDRPGRSNNWRPAVWRSRMWEETGRELKSTAPGGHATPLKTYRLRG